MPGNVIFACFAPHLARETANNLRRCETKRQNLHCATMRWSAQGRAMFWTFLVCFCLDETLGTLKSKHHPLSSVLQRSKLKRPLETHSILQETLVFPRKQKTSPMCLNQQECQHFSALDPKTPPTPPFLKFPDRRGGLELLACSASVSLVFWNVFWLFLVSFAWCHHVFCEVRALDLFCWVDRRLCCSCIFWALLSDFVFANYKLACAHRTFAT